MGMTKSDVPQAGLTRGPNKTKFNKHPHILPHATGAWQNEPETNELKMGLTKAGLPNTGLTARQKKIW